MEGLFKVSLYFKVNYEARYGESIFVVGNIPELGQWKVEKGFPLKWNKVLSLKF